MRKSNLNNTKKRYVFAGVAWSLVFAASLGQVIWSLAQGDGIAGTAGALGMVLCGPQAYENFAQYVHDDDEPEK